MDANRIHKSLARCEIKERNGVDGKEDLLAALGEIVSDYPGNDTLEDIEREMRFEYNQCFSALLPADTMEALRVCLDKTKSMIAKREEFTRRSAHNLGCLYELIHYMTCKHLSGRVVPSCDEPKDMYGAVVALTDGINDKGYIYDNYWASEAYYHLGEVCIKYIEGALENDNYSLLRIAAEELGVSTIRLEQIEEHILKQ